MSEVQLHIQTPLDTEALVSRREGEVKLGQRVQHCTKVSDIVNSSVGFVVFGIAEDIGVLANHGKPGTRHAWKSFLKAFVNVLDNPFNKGENILLLGHIAVDFSPEQHPNMPKEVLGSIVSSIDDAVSELVQTITSCGKVPIIIGGGHNNAFGNLKGLSLGTNDKVNVINIDAHTDLRRTDYRHSGNGFKAAMEEGFLDKYAIFGLHKNYTPTYIFEEIAQFKDQFLVHLFEDLQSTEQTKVAFEEALGFVENISFGLEVDCDAIANFPSSAQSPIGFRLETVRQLIAMSAEHKHCGYLHLCEAAPSPKQEGQVGKALSYLVTTFIQSR